MTIVQKQCLLKFLGYYDGSVDGIWGEKSQRATIGFQQAHGLEVDGIFGANTENAIRKAIAEPSEDWWQGIRYFTREEFACKCGCGYPVQMPRAVVALADRARAHFGAPATVVSGLRCETHNARVGGVANSRHLTGRAIDLRIQGISAVRLLDYLEAEPEVRYAYAINETNVHLDVD